MATALGFLHCPLVVWANSTFKGSALIESITDLADGVFLNEIMMEIDPTYFTLTRIHQSVYGDVNLRMQNLDTLVKHLKGYYQEKLQQLVLLRMPDVVTVAQDPESDEAAEELNKILLLMLGCAVQCENKEHFIERIKEMDLEVQKSLVEYIQQITDNPDNVLAFRANDLAEFSTEQLLLYTESMFYQMRHLVEERDDSIGMISHLSHERDALLQDNQSRMHRTFSPPPSPAVNHNKESPAIHANKEKIRLLTEEIEEKNVALSELRDELLAGKKNLEILRQQNKALSQDARWVKAYRDEIDALKSKADKVDRLEADNSRFKEKLRDLDYHKKRSEELKEQNELLYETRLVLEEQLTGLSSKDERIEIFEEENKKLKTHIHHLAEERQFDQLKLKEVMEENAQLIVDKQNSMAEVASLSSELDMLRGKKSPGSTTLASECSEFSSMEVLRMQRENQQLRKTLDELKNFRQRISELEAENSELRNKAMEEKSTVFNLSDDLAKMKAKGQQQETDLNKLKFIVKRQEEDLKTSVDNVLNLSGELRNKGEALVQMEDHLQLSEEKKQDVAGLYERVKENEKEITNLAKQSESKEEKIAELTKLAQLKDEKMAELNVAAVDREGKIAELVEQIKDKEDVIVKINQKIKEKEDSVAELNESIESRDRRLQSLEKRLKEAAEEQSRTEDVLRNQRQKITGLESKVEDFLSQNKKSEDHLRRKADEINELENRVEESVNQKNRTDENLRRKEKELHELKNRLEKITDENDRLTEELKFKEQKVQSLQKRVEELMLSLDESSEALNKNLREKEKENKSLERRIEELTETVNEMEKIKQVVKEREEKIESLNESFDGKDMLLQDLESRLEESRGENKKLTHVVKLKDKKIEALESSLAEVETTSTVQQDDRIVEMKRNAEGKDHRIIELESRLDDVTLANNKLQQSLKTREQKITELETQIEDVESLSSEKNRLSQSLDHKTKKVLDLETRLEDMSSDNQRLQLSTEQKIGKIRSLENKVMEFEESLGSTHLLHQNIKQKEEKMQALNLVLQEREGKLAELENRLEDSQAQNHRLTHSSKMKEEKIVALEGRVEHLDELVSETNKLNQAVQTKDEKIKALESKLEECEELSSRNTKLTDHLKQKENKINRLQERLNEVEDAVNINAKLNQTVKTREEKIDTLQARINELEDELDNKEKEFRGDKMRTEERIKVLEKSLDDQTTHKVQRQNSVKRRDDKIVDLERRRTKLEEYVEEREGKIHDLQSKLEGTVNRYRKLDMTVGEKEMMIAELQAKLIEAQETAREIRKLNHIMKTKDARIENMETRLEILEGQLAAQNSDISDKDEKIDTLQKRLDETLNLNNKLDQSVRKKEEGIRTLEKTLQANEQREEELETLLESRSEKLSEYKKRVLELEDNLEKKDDKLGELQKRLDDLRSAATADARLSSSLMDKDSKIAEMEERVKELSSSFGQVDKLGKVKKELEKTVLSLETKLEESETQKRRLDHNLKQKEVRLEDLEKRVAEMEASREDNSQSLSLALKQKDSKIGLMTQNLQQQESDKMAMEAKLEEVTAQANKFSRLVEQREEQVRSLKTRLEEAVHQNNKMTHAAELREDKMNSLEKRLQASSKEQLKLKEMLELYDKKAERDKSQKAKGGSSQTIIFKPADTTRGGQNTVEMLAIADKRIADLNDEIRMLEKQSVTVAAQNEAMSARNAQLEIENESVKNEMQNSRADYAAIQTDMNDMRDYYHQIDIAASKMGHRCEMLNQLNATLEEENKALVEQVNKLVEQNQDLLVKSLEDKDQFMDDERAFSDRIYFLQRQKERLEEQVDLANKALAETAKPKKKPNFLARVMRKAGLKKQRKDESPKAKRNSVQLLRVDNSPYLEEFETSTVVSNNDENSGIVVATPFPRLEETDSMGSRESSASGESRGATKTLLNSSLISAQSQVVLRRPREMSPYISTPTLSRADDVDNARHRSATHDVSAFRARQVRSEIFTDSDWSPGRLGRPRSLDGLDRLPSSSSTLTPGDAEARENIPEYDGVIPSTRHLQSPGMRRSPYGSPSTLRKPLWARSSPNISPVPTRKEYAIPLDPPSPVSSRRSVSPRSSPVVSRKIQAEPLNSSPHHTPVLTRKNVTPLSDSRRSSLPNSHSQVLDVVPVRERSVEAPRNSKISVQVIASTNTLEKDTTQSQASKTVVATPLQEDELKRVSAKETQSSPRLEARMLPPTVASPIHERQRSDSGESRGELAASTPRGLQRQRSLSSEKNGVKSTEPSRDQPTLSPYIQHIRDRSSGRDKSDGPLVIQPVPPRESPGRDNNGPVPMYSRDSRDRSSGRNKSDGPVVIQPVPPREGPGRDTNAAAPIHLRERSLSGDRNEGIRISKRQSGQFVAPDVPARQSVPIEAHYVTAGTVEVNEAPATSTSTVSAVGTAVYIDASGLDLSTTPVISHGHRGEVSSSSVYAVVRDKRGDERVIAGSYSTPPSRDLSTPSRDDAPLTRGNATPDSKGAASSYSTPSRSATVVSDSSSSTRVYSVPSTGSLPRNGLNSSGVHVEVKPSPSEQRDENRNDTRVHVSATVLQTQTTSVEDGVNQSASSVRARVLELEQQSPESVRPPPYSTPYQDDNDDARSVTSLDSRDCSPVLRRLRKERRKAGKDKEIFFDSPAPSDAASTASGRRSGTDDKSKARSPGSNQGEGKRSSVWYEYGCV